MGLASTRIGLYPKAADCQSVVGRLVAGTPHESITHTRTPQRPLLRSAEASRSWVPGSLSGSSSNGGFLGPLPDPLPDTDLQLEARAGKDAFVRVLGVDYSVPPTFVGRRIAIRVTPRTVRLTSEGSEIARHERSFVPADVVPADVVLAPAHGRAIRLAREARARLSAGDVELPEIDLARYDALVGALS